MYTLIWNDDNQQYTAVASDNETAWQIYWAIKKLFEPYKLRHVAHMRIFYNGNSVDPTQGSSLPLCKTAENRVILNPGEAIGL